MATKKSRRRNKHWSYSAGERGRNRVRAYQDPKTRSLMLEFSEINSGTGLPKRKRMALGHADKEQAKQQCDKIAAELAANEAPRAEQLTLSELIDIYVREVTPSKGESKSKHDHRAAALFKQLFAKRLPHTLNIRDWNAFIEERKSGRLRPAGSRKKVVGERVIAYDLKFLLAVLNWAERARDARGNRFLDQNPLRGLPLPRNDSPKRPVLAEKQYAALLTVADQVADGFRLALVLAHETGHRIKAIRQLQWGDVDLDGKRIRWRGGNDKLRREHVTPLSTEAVEALAAERTKRLATGTAWLFPSPRDKSQPISRHLARDWWERAAIMAKLPVGERLGWHALRRKFATDLKGMPAKDLCDVGGWLSYQTILTSYMKGDEQTQRSAFEQRANRRACADSWQIDSTNRQYRSF